MTLVGTLALCPSTIPDWFIATILDWFIALLHKELSSSGLTGRSSTPRPLDLFSGASGILGRPVKPGDDDRGVTRSHSRHCERSEAIHAAARKMDCFVASAPLRKRFAFVAGNDVFPHSRGAIRPSRTLIFRPTEGVGLSRTNDVVDCLAGTTRQRVGRNSSAYCADRPTELAEFAALFRTTCYAPNRPRIRLPR
jgi:hypothetical protein